MEKSSRGFVVVIDDDPEMRSMVVDQLQLEGFTVMSFDDGQQALTFLNGNKPEASQVELVISDLRMPEVDGLSLLRNFKLRRRTSLLQNFLQRSRQNSPFSSILL